MKIAKKTTNADRILRTALLLFNKSGVQAVTNRDISKALDISSGNLTYHFNKKIEIVDALVDQMVNEFRAVLEQLPSASENMMARQADSMLNLLRIVWKYRFYFNSIRYLVQVDPSQRRRFNQLRDDLVSFNIEVYEQLVEFHAVKKIEKPNSTRMVVENSWYLWFSLVRLYEVVTVGRKHTEKGFYRFAVEHFFSLLEPHYADSVKQGFYEYIQEKMG